MYLPGPCSRQVYTKGLLRPPRLTINSHVKSLVLEEGLDLLRGCTKTPHPLWLDVSTCGLANSADLADRHTISFRSTARQPYNETFIFNLSHNPYDTEYLSTFVRRDC